MTMPPLSRGPATQAEIAGLDHSYQQSLSWSAIIAGAFVIASLGLILLVLGAGLGLSSVSPWTVRGVSARTIAEGTIAWLVLSQIISCGMGGYLSGRLRHRWARVHVDEIHFRDTAQGFLAWAVAIVLTAGLLTTASSRMVLETMGPTPIESLSVPHLSVPVAGATPSESASLRSSANSARSDQLDVEAERKAAAYGALWLFVALLGGAFSASLFATVGGRHRDHMFPFIS